jgi:Ca-activated chloride channel family protein
LQCERLKEAVVKRVAVLPLLVVSALSVVSAQQAASPAAVQRPVPSDPAPQPGVSTDAAAPVPVFRSGANLVPLSVTVTDSTKQFVKGLTASDFSVFEDGVEQDLKFFEATETPTDLIVLIDTSSSMSDKMDVVHEAASGFLKTMKQGDRGAVVAFADGVDIIQPLTEDRQLLEQGIRRTMARGATSLHNAIYISLKQFGRGAKQDGDLRRQAIAVLSDGEDTSSLVGFDDVLELARKSGVSIYPIVLQSRYAASRTTAVGQRRFYSEAEYSMRTLAQETGAQAYFPAQIFELKGIYASIAQELSSQYSLAYSPNNGRADGRFRKIAVRIAARPDLKLRTRTGYTADLPRAVSSAFHPPER